MLKLRAVAVLVGASVLGACGPEADLGETQPKMSLEEFKATVFHDPEGKIIVDGDQAFDSMEEVESFYHGTVASDYNDAVDGPLRQRTDGLAVARQAGKDVKYTPSQATNLTYCVSNLFGANKAKMVKAMKSAAASWEATSRVNFIHLTQYDANCTAKQQGVWFDVRPVNVNGTYVARAFFPNSSRSGRNILTDKSAFGNMGAVTLTGVIRHELGHVLGFRHEHTRLRNSGCYEDSNWRALTPYDAKSVMHYPHCKGTQTGDLVLTNSDKTGARKLYP